MLVMLYYIFILHQTTTRPLHDVDSTGCIISSFYIKPQQTEAWRSTEPSCIISSFYIKPQPVNMK